MPGEIFASLGAIKTALDIVQGLKNVSDVSRSQQGGYRT